MGKRTLSPKTRDLCSDGRSLLLIMGVGGADTGRQPIAVALLAEATARGFKGPGPPLTSSFFIIFPPFGSQMLKTRALKKKKVGEIRK